VADVSSRYAEAPEEVGFKGKNDCEAVYVGAKPGCALRTPGPELRSDVIEDWDPSCPGGPRHTQVKPRIVYQDGEVVVAGGQIVT
jgi:hypothetical protein